MRIIRLRVANYRGINEHEVNFRPNGITLLQGPNEVGKSSLGEAIVFLFEYLDSSKHRNLEAIRPVHRDEGPEIELQAESGPYSFTYFKRFYKKPETKLTITRPKPENYTGREAHERAEAILRETLDLDLWKALTIQQGDAIHQPDLTKQTSLSAALDKVAGGHPADPLEESLFDKVREEYSRYFTERSTEKKELQEARKFQTDTQADISTIEQHIQDLEHDIERAATLQRELPRLRKREEEIGEMVVAHSASLDEIVTLENALAEARLKLDSAQKSEQAARRDKDERQRLIDEVAEAAKHHKDLLESSEMLLPALKKVENELDKAQKAFDTARNIKRGADTLAALRRGDFDYYNNKLHLEQLRERKERIDAARKNAEHAESVLVKNKIDELSLKSIQDAERGLLTANAQFETGAPSVLLRSLAECSLQIDETNLTLAMDEVRTLSVADKMRLTVPQTLDIEITAGSSIADISKKVEEAKDALDIACTAAGVGNPDEAVRAFEERREANRHVASKEQAEKDNLRDLTYEELERKLIGLQQSVSGYLANRLQEPALCPNLEIAKKERATAEMTVQQANEDLEAASESLDAARSVHGELSTKHLEGKVHLEISTKNLSHTEENLERAQKAVPDNQLDANLVDASRTVSLEKYNVQTAEASLSAKNPERVKALAETAKGSLQTTQNRRSTAQTELTEVQTRLKIHGEEGLHEKLDAAQSRFEHLKKDNIALFRRAAAAKLLFGTMREERDKTRRAYVAPIKEKIEHLGRLVFDNSFQVDISDDLLIASRTVKGITVPFDSLSGGTKEQLSLIFRLACSMIVAKDGGTPLILDDALGYTDIDRLNLMGAVLAIAAKECQIVILTCMPERYSNIGEATVVSLRY